MAAWSNDVERRRVHSGWWATTNYAATLAFLAFVIWMIWGH
jgi:hypothetical protein